MRISNDFEDNDNQYETTDDVQDTHGRTSDDFDIACGDVFTEADLCAPGRAQGTFNDTN